MGIRSFFKERFGGGSPIALGLSKDAETQAEGTGQGGKRRFESSQAEQIGLFEQEGKSRLSYSARIYDQAEKKARQTEGKVTTLLGRLAARLEKFSATLQEKAKQHEQKRIARTAERAVRKEESIANVRGNIDYDRITQLNLTPRTKEERQVFARTLAADKEAFQKRIGRADAALRELEGVSPEASRQTSAATLMERIEEAQRLGRPVQLSNVEVVPSTEIRKAEIKGKMEKGGVMSAGDLMILIEQAQKAGIPVKISAEIGGTSKPKVTEIPTHPEQEKLAA